MITLANIKRSIYNICKRLDIIELNIGNSGGSLQGGSTTVSQVQADWNQSDSNEVDYIKNKPTIPAEQIQSDWNQTDDTKKDYIKNKPNVVNGLDGSDGKSAYELAVENGYSGTVQEWLASLHGLDGTNGTNGQDGQNGTNGITPSIDPTSKHWMIGETDTNVLAEGQNGQNGLDGHDGTDGITPHIDPTTKHWMIGTTDTGIVAEGLDGTTPSVPGNETAVSGGNTLSVVTTGEKYTWNNKANIWRGTQAQYDLLTPDDNTIYIITTASS